MREIALTNGGVALVDDEDYELVSQYKWFKVLCKKTWYAWTTTNKHIRMHRLIMDFPESGIIDHTNHNGLDNRRSNLRMATHSLSQANRRKQSNNTSGYKGGYRMAKGRRKQWCADLMFEKKKYKLGYYHTPEEAAMAYDAKAKEMFGEFACLNFPS